VKIVWAAAVAVLLFGVIGAGAATGTATRQPLRATDTAASVQTRALAPVAPASGSSRSPVTARSTGSRATPAPPLPGVSAVLYDQYNNDSTVGLASTERGDTSTSQAADDFVIPGGDTWTIDEVDVPGANAFPSPTAFNVYFYTNNPVTNLPDVLVAQEFGRPVGGTNPNFVVTLSPAVRLTAGHYWVSVQGVLTGNNWYWEGRTVTSNASTAWQNPGDGFATGCTTWNRASTCIGSAWPDQMFRLRGSSARIVDHTGSIASTDPTITDAGGRMFRNGTASTCAAPKTFPGRAGGANTYHYRTHTIKNASASSACVTVTFDPQTCVAGTNPLNIAAYLNSFNPADVSQNYLADLGLSPSQAPATFSFTIPAGGKVVLVISEVTANSGCPAYNIAENAPTVSPAYAEAFDGVTAPALPSGWVAQNASGVAPLWTTSKTGTPTPVADSAPNAAFVDDPPTVSDKRLTSPSLAIRTTSAQLSFWQNYDLETGFDGGVLEISISGGAFQDILAAGGSFDARGYSGTISTVFSNPLAGRQAWTGNTNGFVYTKVNLPASAAGHSIQLRWRMGSDTSVSHSGWRIDSIQLRDGQRVTVVKAGNGSGTVTSNPAGVSCGTACSNTFDVGSSVVLTAAPSVGTSFAGWSGAGCSGTGTCTVAVNAAKTVTANFALQSRSLTVTKTGNGVGKVTSAPAGVSCPTACLASFLYGTSLTLTATPSAKAIFSGWTGDCTGTTKTCALSMTANHAATAKFTAKCVVPKVVGKTLKKARARIKKAHCRVGKIKKKASTKKKKGRVLKQKPKPGKILKPGAKVNLTVGRGGL
jgi:uncharacterized repeat protein (TIGR02543 family)